MGLQILWSPVRSRSHPYDHTIFLVSLDGQDTRFSPWRPGFDSRTRNHYSIFWCEAMAQLAARRIPDPKVGGSTPSSFTGEYVNFFWLTYHKKDPRSTCCMPLCMSQRLAHAQIFLKGFVPRNNFLLPREFLIADVSYNNRRAWSSWLWRLPNTQ